MAPFAGYGGLSANIKQDVEKVVNAAYKDARYGGNERMRVRPTHITLTVYYN